MLNTPAEKQALIDRIDLFCDSFCVFTQHDSSLLNKIKPQFHLLKDLLNTHREDQKLLFLSSLEIQMLVVTSQLLQLWGAQTNEDNIGWRSFLPNITINQSCVRVGEPFYGMVSLDAYSAHESNVAYFCNGKKLPLKDGLGKMRLKTTSKSQKYTVKAIIKNPFTGSIEHFSKEFPVDVCKE